MDGHTHLAGGALASLGLAAAMHPPALAGCLAAGLVGSVLPDWDHPASIVGRWVPSLVLPGVMRVQGPHGPEIQPWRRLVHVPGFPPPPRTLGVGRRVALSGVVAWHRGPASHSPGALAAWVLLAFVASLAWWPGAAWAVALFLGLGYASHLALDGLNPSGVPLWPLPGKLRLAGIRSGGAGDHALFLGLVAVLGLILWRDLPAMGGRLAVGARDAVRGGVGDLAAVVRGLLTHGLQLKGGGL